MEPEQNESVQESSKLENLRQATPFSKYLAMLLFVALPFIGGWIGYTFVPEKVIENDAVISTAGNNNVSTESTTNNKVITLAQNTYFDTGHKIRLDESETDKYVVDGKNIISSEGAGFYGVELIKLDDEYVVLRAITNPAGGFENFLVNEMTGEVVKEIANYPRLGPDDGIWSSKGKHYFVSGDRVLVNDYVASTTEILYEETNPSLTLIEDGGMGGAWGNLHFGAFEEYLLVARYESDMTNESNEILLPKERFVDVRLIDIRSAEPQD